MPPPLGPPRPTWHQTRRVGFGPFPPRKGGYSAFRFYTDRLGVELRVRARTTSRQPWGTRQCGTHAIVRAVLLSINLNFAFPNVPVTDFQLLRRLLPTSSAITQQPLPALLAAITHPSLIEAATTNSHPPFQTHPSGKASAPPR